MPGARACCSTSTRSGCGRRSRGWPTGSRRGGTSCWRRTSSTATAAPPTLAPAATCASRARREAFFASGVVQRVEALHAGQGPGRDAEAWVAALREPPVTGRSAPPATAWERGSRSGTAASSPELVAAVGGFHGGRLVTDGPDSPHLAIAAARPTYAFGHADHDRSMTVEDVAALGAALQAAGTAVRQRDLPGAPARILDGRHLDVPRGRRRAALHRARGPARRRRCGPD